MLTLHIISSEKNNLVWEHSQVSETFTLVPDSKFIISSDVLTDCGISSLLWANNVCVFRINLKWKHVSSLNIHSAVLGVRDIQGPLVQCLQNFNRFSSMLEEETEAWGEAWGSQSVSPWPKDSPLSQLTIEVSNDCVKSPALVPQLASSTVGIQTRSLPL